MGFRWSGALSVVLVGLWAQPAIAGDGTFPQAVGASAIPVGNSPRALAIADLNNDGRQDIAVANQGGTVSLLLGDGAGAFQNGTSLSATNAPEDIASGDFNNDGNVDLAVSRSNQGVVSIFLGNGNATFAAPTDVPSGGGNPQGIAVGDVEGDGDEDLAITNSSNDVVLVRLGDGTGAFPTTATSSPIAAPDSPYRVEFGDANNDGKADLYVTTAQSPANVHILLGNGAGVFTQAPGSPLQGAYGGTPPRLGDFNGDGNEDFAHVSAIGPVAAVRLGDGTGRFTAAPDVDLPDTSVALALGDFNSDGNEDLIGMNRTTQKLLVRFGDGQGGFPGEPSGTSADTGTSAWDAAVGDFNADGNADVALANISTNAVTIRLGGGPPADAGNLLVNGGAEATPGTAAAGRFGLQTPIPGWTISGPFSNHRYSGADRYPDYSDAARWQGQQAFFAIGATTGTSSASQTVDVAGSAALIDAGDATATLRGYLGGFRLADDTMQATATFKNAGGVPIGTPLQIGPVTTVDRKNRTTMLPRSVAGAVPSGTRSITVTLTGTHGASAFQDSAYADRMALFLTGTSTPVGPDTTPPETTITKEPKAKSSRAKAKYRFISSEPNSTFQCKFDRKPFKPCDSGKAKYKRLDFGKHKFRVIATDAAGNADPSPAKDKFKRR